MEIKNNIFVGNCVELLPSFPKESVNFVFTSPPYAEQRKNFYNSITTNDYPQFTLSWMNALKHSLTEDGSVVINIREHELNGVQDPYVLKTVLHLIENGWNWCGKFIWHKTISAPLGSKKRLRRAFEDLYWFSPTNKPYINAKALGKMGKAGFENKNYFNAGLCRQHKKMVDAVVRSTDVFSVSLKKNLGGNPHPAQFPEELASQIIKIFCPDNGLVLDPFIGSGTVGAAAKNQGKSYCGIELNSAYVNYAQQRISQVSLKADSPALSQQQLWQEDQDSDNEC